MFFDQKAPVVLDLVEAVGDVLFDGLIARFEHQLQLGAVERAGVEAGCGGGDAEHQAVVAEDAVAQVQPQRAGLAGGDGDRDVDHVACGPDGVLDADIERDAAVVGGRQVQRRQGDGDAVQAVVHVFPAVGPAAHQRLVRRRVAQAGRHQDVHDWLLRACCDLVAGALARGRLRGQRDHGLALARWVAAGDDSAQLGEVVVVGLDVAAHGIAELRAAFGHLAWLHVIGPDFLDGRFLRGVGKAQRTAAAFFELIHAAHHALLACEQRLRLCVGRGVSGLAVGGAAQLDAVERLVRQGEVERLAAFDIGVPVWQLEVVVAPGQARAVVDAGPGGFGDAVGGLPHPLLEIARIGEFHLADARDRCGQCRRCMAVVPAVAMQEGGVLCVRSDRGCGGGFLQACECGGTAAIEHAVVDADLVEVAAAQEVVAALHLVRRHHPAGQAELVECGIVIERATVCAWRAAVHACGFLAVHVQAHAAGFVPGEGDVGPVIGLWQRVELEGDTGAREVGVGDEGIEAVAVPVDAQPGHIPAGVVGVADAEDHERRFADRVTRPPEEAERAALGVEIAGRIPRQHAVVGPFDGVAAFAGGHQRDLVAEVGHAVAAGDIGSQTAIGRDAEQQLRCIGSGRTHRQRNQQQHTHPPLLHAHCLTPQNASPHGITARRILDTAWR
ncbi:hypothetical protein CKU38_00155 [Xanthomonas citri pv. fuscans]|nr:hypothetical protein CKU38_00155 [Xanthomonas citri pv. fuscans]